MTSPLSYSNAELLAILRNTRSNAIVGASPKWNRPSSFAMKYLQEKGFRVIPVNPGHAGKEILGETVYASLSDIPASFDMVDIFRNSEAAGPVTDEAIAIAEEKGIKVVWMQLGVTNHAAAARARAAGPTVVMDRCPKIAFGRLHAAPPWGGFNYDRK